MLCPIDMDKNKILSGTIIQLTQTSEHIKNIKHVPRASLHAKIAWSFSKA